MSLLKRIWSELKMFFFLGVHCLSHDDDDNDDNDNGGNDDNNAIWTVSASCLKS